MTTMSPAHRLARLHAGSLNALVRAGAPTASVLADADADLAGSGWSVLEHAGRFVPATAGDEPAGGFTLSLAVATGQRRGRLSLALASALRGCRGNDWQSDRVRQTLQGKLVELSTLAEEASPEAAGRRLWEALGRDVCRELADELGKLLPPEDAPRPAAVTAPSGRAVPDYNDTFSVTTWSTPTGVVRRSKAGTEQQRRVTLGHGVGRTFWYSAKRRAIAWQPARAEPRRRFDVTTNDDGTASISSARRAAKRVQ